MGNTKKSRHIGAYHSYRHEVLDALKKHRAIPDPPRELGHAHIQSAIEWARASLPASHGHSLERHAARSAGRSNRRGRQARSRG